MKIAPHNLSGAYWFAALGIAYAIQFGIVYDLESGWGSPGIRWLRHVFEPNNREWIIHILLPFGMLVLTGVLWPGKMIYLWPAVILASFLILRSFVVLIEV